MLTPEGSGWTRIRSTGGSRSKRGYRKRKLPDKKPGILILEVEFDSKRKLPRLLRRASISPPEFKMT